MAKDYHKFRYGAKAVHLAGILRDKIYLARLSGSYSASNSVFMILELARLIDSLLC